MARTAAGGPGRDKPGGGPATGPHMEVLSRAACLKLLGTVPVGRVGLSYGGLPVVLPVNFILHRDALVIRVASGTKLAAAVAGQVMAFEVDRYDEDAGTAWSVLVLGRATEITDTFSRASLDQLPLRAWVLGGAATHYVRIETTTVTGRRFHWEVGGTERRSDA